MSYTGLTCEARSVQSRFSSNLLKPNQQRKENMRNKITLIVLLTGLGLLSSSCADYFYYRDGWRIEESTFDSYEPSPYENVDLEVSWVSVEHWNEDDLIVSFRVPQNETLSKQNSYSTFCKYKGLSFEVGHNENRSVQASCAAMETGYFVFQIQNTKPYDIEVELTLDHNHFDGFERFTQYGTQRVTIYALGQKDIGFSVY